MLESLKKNISKKIKAVGLIFIALEIFFLAYTVYLFYSVETKTVLNQQKQINRLVSIENGFTESIRQSAKQETAGQYDDALRKNDEKNDQILIAIDDLKSKIINNDQNSDPAKADPSIKVIADYLPKVVKLICPTEGLENTFSIGSGSFSSNGLITTNAHVVEFDGNLCMVGITNNSNKPPEIKYYAKVNYINKNIDIASLSIKYKYNADYPSLLEPINLDDLNTGHITKADICRTNSLNIGDKIMIIGYPAVGGNTITVTEGIVSGFEGYYIKTSAKIEHGNSGGIAVSNNGCMVGVPVSSVAGSLESMGRIINFSEFLE